MSRTTLTLAASALAISGLFATTAATAAPADRQPTPQARGAGITRPGEAAMGWKERTVTPARSTAVIPSGVPGIDVSNWQGQVDWAGQYATGKRFAYVKATEGTTYTSPSFGHQYTGSYNAGFLRGAYHFALPDGSSGASQADHFVDNGGGWSADGKTLPGTLDMEWNPYGATCYGKTQTQLRSWISAFLDQYKARTGRYPVVYTATSWWNQCVGSDAAIAAKSPLWLARYAGTPGTLPEGWSTHSFWQYSESPIDQNVWHGTLDRLKYFAAH